jgi:predicted DNA-binding transcriptional regulator YafY
MGKKMTEISTFERALDVIQRLQAGQRMTVLNIAEIYEISHRQAFRVWKTIKLTLPVRTVGSGPCQMYIVWPR